MFFYTSLFFYKNLLFLDVTVGDFTFSKYDVAPEIRSIGWGLADSTAAHLPGILDTPDLEGRSLFFCSLNYGVEFVSSKKLRAYSLVHVK